MRKLFRYDICPFLALHEGKSTRFRETRARWHHLASRIAELRALAHFKALTDPYRLDGSLLERREIAAPGCQPVEQIDCLPKLILTMMGKHRSKMALKPQ